MTDVATAEHLGERALAPAARRKRKRLALIAIAGLLASLFTLTTVATASAAPNCQSADSDPDGDGWGWENNQSCQVTTQTDPTNGSNCVDPDGDGWGWDGTQSCQIASPSSPSTTNDGTQVCANDYDPDGDGWGWENNATCIHQAGTPTNVRIETDEYGIGTLRWDPVGGSAGYIVYRDGSEFATINGKRTYNGVYRFSGANNNYYVKAFKQGEVALSDASQVVRFNDPVVQQPINPLVEISSEPVILRKAADGRLAITSVTDDDHIRLVYVGAGGAVEVFEMVEDAESDSGWDIWNFHYEDRDALNTGLPDDLNTAVFDDDWFELEQWQSEAHQDPNTPGVERKFIHADGREAVYYPNSGQLVTDPKYRGTFNYVNARALPSDVTELSDLPEYVWDLTAFAWYGTGHGIADYLPWKILNNGNVRGVDPETTGNNDTTEPDYNYCGTADCQEGEFGGMIDSDGDGFADNVDAFPNDPNLHSTSQVANEPEEEIQDMDGDGIPDSIDPDRDGDGYNNNEDDYPNDRHRHEEDDDPDPKPEYDPEEDYCGGDCPGGEFG